MSTFYVDELRDNPKGRDAGGRLPESSHLWTDGTREELDQFALSLGLVLSWSHTSYGYARTESGIVRWEFYHFDVSPQKRTLAIRAGAIYMSQYNWIKRKREELAGSSLNSINSPEFAQSPDEGSPE